MALIDDVKAEPAGPGARCSVAEFLASLSADDQAEVIEVMAEPNSVVGSAALARVLARRYGNAPKSQTLQRHRRRGCSCG